MAPKRVAVFMARTMTGTSAKVKQAQKRRCGPDQYILCFSKNLRAIPRTGDADQRAFDIFGSTLATREIVPNVFAPHSAYGKESLIPKSDHGGERHSFEMLNKSPSFTHMGDARHGGLRLLF